MRWSLCLLFTLWEIRSPLDLVLL